MRRLILPAVMMAVALAVPAIIASPYYIQIIIQLVIYGILFVGMDVAVGHAGLVSMAHGALFGIGAYITGILTVLHGWAFWPTIPLAALGAALVGLLVGVITLKLAGHYFVVATLGLGAVVTIIIANWTPVTNGNVGLSPIPVPESPFGDWFIELGPTYYLMLLVALCVTLGVWLLMRTGTGQRLRAIRDNPALASATGVDVARARLVAFVVSAGIAGMAGGFQASYVAYINPTISGLDFAFTALLAIIVGGRASVAGPYLGAAIFVALPEIARDADEYRLIVLGAALVIVVIFAPDGIAGRLSAAGHAIGRRLRQESRTTGVAMDGEAA